MSPHPASACLRSAMSYLLSCDRTDVVQGIYRYVQTQHPAARMLVAAIARTKQTPLPAAVALLGGFRCFVHVHLRSPADDGDGVVSVARRDNERRAIGELRELVPELAWNEFVFDWHGSPAAVLELARLVSRAPRRIGRAMMRLDRRLAFLPLFRVVELLAYYQRYCGLFACHRFSLAVMSSHTNPHGIAFNLAARKFGVPVVLTTHGLPLLPVARLSYDLALVHSEAAKQAYLRAGCPMGQIIIKGRRSHYAPMPARPLSARLAVGVFLAKDVQEVRLLATLRMLASSRQVSRVLVRPHPTNLWVKIEERLAPLRPFVSLSASRPLDEDLNKCDCVLAGNSSVLVEAVTAGKPCGYVRDLDNGPYDLYSLVERGLVFDLGDCAAFRPDEMLGFYERPEWTGVLREFANVDEDETEVARRVESAMLSLARLQSAPIRKPALPH